MINLLADAQLDPGQWHELVRDAVGVLRDIQTGIQNNNSLIYSILGIIIGAGLAVVGTYISRRFSDGQERRALQGILEDLYRHFQANVQILNNINLENGIPSRLYFGRFKVDGASIVFSDSICKSIRRKHLKEFNQLRLLYRNGNIELDVICEYMVSNRYDKDVMRQYIDEVVLSRQDCLMKKTKEFRKSMGNKRPVRFPQEEPREIKIVYEEGCKPKTAKPVCRAMPYRRPVFLFPRRRR